MTRLVLDASMISRLRNLSELLEVCNESGQTLGYFHPTTGDKAKMIRSPFSREELERFRQERTGRSLAEILEDLEKS